MVLDMDLASASPETTRSSAGSLQRIAAGMCGSHVMPVIRFPSFQMMNKYLLQVALAHTMVETFEALKSSFISDVPYTVKGLPDLCCVSIKGRTVFRGLKVSV